MCACAGADHELGVEVVLERVAVQDELQLLEQAERLEEGGGDVTGRRMVLDR